MRIVTRFIAALLLAIASSDAAERINHAGRILGPAPTVAVPTLFNTVQADAVLAAMQIMPVDNPWNEDISTLPVLANSTAMMTKIRNDLDISRRFFNAFEEMNFVLVPDGQADVPITFIDYPGESDPGPYPIAANTPIETWPSGTGSLTVYEWQEHLAAGDRHAIWVKPAAGLFWETWQTRRIGSAWQASNGARFDLTSNALRIAGWTSADAAGLPMFPALVRYDEVQRGAIEHAMRVVVRRTRAAYLYPGNHFASNPFTLDPDTPAMGERLRLKAGTVIPAGWSNEAKVIATALKKYGCLVADNGGFFQISVTPDQRWPSGCFDDLTALVPADFEVVQGTGPTGGPRSPAPPTANAGVDQSIVLGSPASLAGLVSGAITTTWSAYPGAPGTVNFANANLASTTATFSSAGVYTLLLTVADGVHTPAYDALVVTVTAPGNNPVPVANSLSPANAMAGGAGFTLTIAGANFVSGATVTWTGQAALAPATRTATQITVVIPAAYIASSGVADVAVVNPLPGGGSSSARSFVVNAASGGGGGGGGSSASGSGSCGGGLALSLLCVFVGLNFPSRSVARRMPMVKNPD